MMNPPPPMRLPPEPGEPRNEPERGDVPIDEADLVETGGWCCLWAALAALFPSAIMTALAAILAIHAEQALVPR
jgi:hypothetical protein